MKTERWIRPITILAGLCLFISLAYAHQETCPRCGGTGVIPGPVLNGIQSYYGCPGCGGSGGGGAPGLKGKGWIEVPDAVQLADENIQAADAAAAEAERNRANEERQRKFEEEQRRAQEEFARIKQDALNSMKGLGGTDLALKGVGSSDDLGLRGVGGSQTDNLGLKGMDDTGGLKDAVADSSVKTLFDKKDASRDLLSAHAHGITALDRAANILQNATSNPLLETSLEHAKAETDRRFSTGGRDAGQFSTVVLIGASGSTFDSKPVHVPAEVAKDPRFQKLVVERDALDHQIDAAQEKLKNIKTDPSYSQSASLLTEAYKENNALESLKVMRAYDTSQITRMVHLESVDLGDDSTPATPTKNLDTANVPPPPSRPATP